MFWHKLTELWYGVCFVFFRGEGVGWEQSDPLPTEDVGWKETLHFPTLPRTGLGEGPDQSLPRSTKVDWLLSAPLSALCFVMDFFLPLLTIILISWPGWFYEVHDLILFVFYFWNWTWQIVWLCCFTITFCIVLPVLQWVLLAHVLCNLAYMLNDLHAAW